MVRSLSWIIFKGYECDSTISCYIDNYIWVFDVMILFAHREEYFLMGEPLEIPICLPIWKLMRIYMNSFIFCLLRHSY